MHKNRGNTVSKRRQYGLSNLGEGLGYCMCT